MKKFSLPSHKPRSTTPTEPKARRRLSARSLFRIAAVIIILVLAIIYAKQKTDKTAKSGGNNSVAKTGNLVGDSDNTGGSPQPSRTFAPDEPAIIQIVFTDKVEEDGKIGTPTDTFSTTTQNIYALAGLQNAKKDMEIGYTRYYEGQFVNSNTFKIPSDDIKVFPFQWQLLDGKTRAPGKYSLTFTFNGVEMATVSYNVK